MTQKAFDLVLELLDLITLLSKNRDFASNLDGYNEEWRAKLNTDWIPCNTAGTG